MKVHYVPVKTVDRQILSAIQAANTLCKRLDHIELTVDEANELAVYLNTISWYSDRLVKGPYTFADCGKEIGFMYDVQIKIEPAIPKQ